MINDRNIRYTPVIITVTYDSSINKFILLIYDRNIYVIYDLRINVIYETNITTEE